MDATKEVKMIRNLKRMIGDERGMATLATCEFYSIMEIIFIIFPCDWLCCIPCVYPLAYLCLPYGIILDVILAPVEILFCYLVGTSGIFARLGEILG